MQCYCGQNVCQCDGPVEEDPYGGWGAQGRIWAQVDEQEKEIRRLREENRYLEREATRRRTWCFTDDPMASD